MISELVCVTWFIVCFDGCTLWVSCLDCDFDFGLVGGCSCLRLGFPFRWWVFVFCFLCCGL